MNNSKIARRSLATAVALALAGLTTTAQAIEFSSGEFSGSFDTTISYGALWRAEDIDPDYADELRRSIEAGVQTLAYRADVSPQGITVVEPVPIEL